MYFLGFALGIPLYRRLIFTLFAYILTPYA
jgi:hypothetical protein